MKAVVFSIGESTTDLCVWSLKRNGFDVVLYQSSTSLWQKLKDCYGDMDEDFVRVDADVVPNKVLRPENLRAPDDVWWVQYLTYDWYKQNSTHGGVQFIKKEALPVLRSRVDYFKGQDRPETMLFRVSEFHNPRRCITHDVIMGLNGYKQKDVERVKAVKRRRNQYDNYDWELMQKLEEL